MKPADRKKSGLARRKLSDDQPLHVETETMPGLSPGLEMQFTKLAKGIVRLSEFYGIGTPSARASGESSEPEFGLRYASMREMDTDHGMSVISGILIDADLWALGPNQREALIAEIRPHVSGKIWPMIAKSLRPPREDAGEDDLRGPFVVALWAEIFAEPLSDLWLAAMAQHAYWIEQNEFAFGYLTALLDNREKTEADFLRGRKMVESGRAGAEIRAAQSRIRTQGVLVHMGRLIASGHSVSRAAQIVADGGMGKSAAANRKLWSRHHKS